MLTAADLASRVAPMHASGPVGLATPAYGPLADDRVRFVGDPVALVVAASRAVAEDACELVDVDYEPLEPVADVEGALAPDAPVLFDAVGTNLMFHETVRTGDVDAAFAVAEHRSRWSFRQHRQCNAPLEGRAGLVDCSPDTGDVVYCAAHQNPHALRVAVAELLGIPTHRFHVRTDDVGGSFGQKAYVSREDVALCAAGMMLGRPLKWIEDRVENLQAAGQAREETFDVEAAFDSDGTVRAVRVAMVLDQGAYQLTTLPPTIFPTIVRVLFPGAYRIEHLEFDVKVVATNKATYVAYRGPWESETFVRERMLDLVARELGMTPEAIRDRNLRGHDEFPTAMVTGPTLDARDRARRRSRAPSSSPDPRRSGSSRHGRGRTAARPGSAWPRCSSRRPGHRTTAGPRRGRVAAHRAARDGPARARRDADRVHEPVTPRTGPPHDARPARGRRARALPRPGAGGVGRHAGDAVQPRRHRRQPRRHTGERRGHGRGRRRARSGAPASPRTCSRPRRTTSCSPTAWSPSPGYRPRDARWPMSRSSRTGTPRSCRPT